MTLAGKRVQHVARFGPAFDACTQSTHEALKRDRAKFLDATAPLGFSIGLEWRTCRRCGSTLAVVAAS